MNRPASLFMSAPDILISVNHLNPPPSSISQRECGWIKRASVNRGRQMQWFLFHYFQCFMHLFCRMFSLFIRLGSTHLCFADAAKQNDLSQTSVQIKESEVWFISGDSRQKEGSRRECWSLSDVTNLGHGFDWIHTTAPMWTSLLLATPWQLLSQAADVIKIAEADTSESYYWHHWNPEQKLQQFEKFSWRFPGLPLNQIQIKRTEVFAVSTSSSTSQHDKNNTGKNL